MASLRCTARLLERLKQKPETDLPPPTGKLGDWYANLLNIRRHRLVLCTSDRTLLTVVAPIRQSDRLRERIRESVERLLLTLGVPQDAVLEETEGMEAMPFGKTASRSVLGSMNDFSLQCKYYFHGAEETVYLSELDLGLSDTPCGPLDYKSPADATLEAFGVSPADVLIPKSHLRELERRLTEPDPSGVPWSELRARLGLGGC